MYRWMYYLSYQCKSALTPYSQVFFLQYFMSTNQSQCGPCGCAEADPAAGASDGLMSLWGCCKHIIPQSDCATVQNKNNQTETCYYSKITLSAALDLHEYILLHLLYSTFLLHLFFYRKFLIKILIIHFHIHFVSDLFYSKYVSQRSFKANFVENFQKYIFFYLCFTITFVHHI